MYGLATLVDMFLDEENHGYATVDDKSLVTNVLSILYTRVCVAYLRATVVCVQFVGTALDGRVFAERRSGTGVVVGGQRAKSAT